MVFQSNDRCQDIFSSPYTVIRESPTKIIEFYFNEFSRGIVVSLGSSTLLNIDVYPRKIEPKISGVSVSIDNVDLVIESRKDLVPIVCRTLGIDEHVVERVELLYICLRRDEKKFCDLVNAKIFFSMNLEDVVKLIDLCKVDTLSKELREVGHN